MECEHTSPEQLKCKGKGIQNCLWCCVFPSSRHFKNYHEFQGLQWNLHCLSLVNIHLCSAVELIGGLDRFVNVGSWYSTVHYQFSELTAPSGLFLFLLSTCNVVLTFLRWNVSCLSGHYAIFSASMRPLLTDTKIKSFLIKCLNPFFISHRNVSHPCIVEELLVAKFIRPFGATSKMSPTCSLQGSKQLRSDPVKCLQNVTMVSGPWCEM